MPWTEDDVESHKKGLSKKGKAQWVAVANSVLERCVKNGGDEKTCAASAIRQANGVTGNEMQIHIVQNKLTLRTEMHQGRRHLVVPVIMMVEGVHAGSHGPLYHSIEELGRFPAAWNGIPVTIGHPEIDGQNVSANQPSIIDSRTVGRIYNTHIYDNQLRAEAWIDEEKLSAISPQALSYLREGRPLEVSVGIFSDEDPTTGIWHDEPYVAIAKNHRPDHLALLPGSVGACSWADGCGVRTNEEGGDAEVNKDGCEGGKSKKKKKKDEEEEELGVMSEEEPDALKEMSGKSINDLPDSAFAYIESGGEKDESGKTTPRSLRHFPVHDAAHARNALARASQSPFGAKAMAKIKAACKKFGIQVSDNEEQVPPEEPAADTVINAAVSEEVSNNLDTGGTKEMPEEKKPCCPGKVEVLIQSKHSPYEEIDREWLLGLEESQIDRMIQTDGLLIAAAKKAEEVPQVNEEQAVAALKETLSDPEKFIALLPPAIQEEMKSGMTLHREKRQKLMQIIIQANPKKFNEENLKGRTMDTLEELVSMIPEKPDYSVNAAGGNAVPKMRVLPPAGVEFK